MYDDLQNTAAFLDDLEEDLETEAAPAVKAAPRKRSPRISRIFGMTPVQLFVISIELFMMVCILGFFFMIITEKMVLPV